MMEFINQGSFEEDGVWNCMLVVKTSLPLYLQILFAERSSYLSGKSMSIEECATPEWLVVTPVMKIKGNEVKPKQLRVMTVLPRCIGKINKWEEFFKDQIANGYNAFHLAPIQELGISNSLYCIKNHCKLSQALFDSTDPKEQWKELETVLKNVREKYGCLFFIDIVLNHCAKNADWQLSTIKYSKANKKRNNLKLIRPFIIF